MATLSASGTSDISYIEWSPIIAGSIFACAITFVLTQFGNALGLSITHPYNDTYTAWKVITIGLWVLWMQLMSSMAGGYMAGRMRSSWEGSPHESEMRDGVHGLLVWATSSLMVAIAITLAAFVAALAAAHGVTAENHPEISETMARRYGIIFGFGLAATSIVSAVAAWWMGTVGGDHRDKNVDVSRFISFRRK
jgi:hypothetical protein